MQTKHSLPADSNPRHSACTSTLEEKPLPLVHTQVLLLISVKIIYFFNAEIYCNTMCSHHTLKTTTTVDNITCSTSELGLISNSCTNWDSLKVRHMISLLLLTSPAAFANPSPVSNWVRGADGPGPGARWGLRSHRQNVRDHFPHCVSDPVHLPASTRKLQCAAIQIWV